MIVIQSILRCFVSYCSKAINFLKGLSFPHHAQLENLIYDLVTLKLTSMNTCFKENKLSSRSLVSALNWLLS